MGGPAAPPGLEALAEMDFIRIRQNIEWCEVCCCGCCETENEYDICNKNGVKIFHVKEGDFNTISKYHLLKSYKEIIQNPTYATGSPVGMAGPLICM